MTIRNLDSVFRPKVVAVVGASDQPGKVGHTLLKNLVEHGYTGRVYPINATRDTVQGMTAYRDLVQLPEKPDLVVICTPSTTVPKLIEQCGQLGIMGVVIISAGFREVGPAGMQLEQQIREIQKSYPGLRVLGPNCLGFLVPDLKLSASFARGMPKPGRLAFLSQSGALCTAVLDWALDAGIGFSHFVSLGNMLDVGLDDMLDYLAADPTTDAVILYVESISRAREFMSAARAFASHKPIVAYKAGRFSDSAKAASSHTGAMAGVDAVYEAAFQRAGIVRVFDVDDMFDCAELLSRRKMPRGARLGIITNAGGPGVMACDALLARHGQIATLTPATIEKLNSVLPPFWSHGNPIDVLGDAPASRYAESLGAVLADPQVDTVLVILTPQDMTDPEATARAVAEVAGRSSKPVLAAWMGRGMVASGVKILGAAGVPTYNTPEHAIRAFMHLVAYAKRREVLYETPRDVPLTFSLDRPTLHARAEQILKSSDGVLTENASKDLLETYGIPVTKPIAASTAAQAVEVARQLGYPVVLKVLSPQISHKTDVQGVKLNLRSDDETAQAFEQIISSARMLRPDADVQGVTVQRMVTAVNSVELILGAKRDPVFGPVIMVGMGGIAAEVYQDRTIELPPLNERLARRMLESLRSWPLLSGYRGRPVVNIDRLVEVLMRFSYLVADLPEVQEVDINPLLVSASDAMALDARVFVSPADVSRLHQRAYAHLAICPYPEEYTRVVQSRSGDRLLLRPVKPEDEPLWVDLLSRCSQETLWRRFRYLFKEATHEMATRFCYVDYDREVALVAEIEKNGTRELVGVGRLVADPDHETAEYAVMVADAWQSCGVGMAITGTMLELAKKWGVREVTGETSYDNWAMRTIFQRYGFQLMGRGSDDVVLARLSLTTNSPDAATNVPPDMA
ncbi:CoA-binding domain protein [Pirellula staleyi DSM 6068]|uniref:CoA-binding domain protein n=1 Tax=Pirellula staleyi (strain ATCC 27377 / DSM 6068 / ICPB 4128) TaxID=530564 RepID=D2R7V1_PIRSD|nr:bifunctional acetate--CoA ligase family protein/GNAT family N-acetyltransferase [Pirellula staleyi]ADB19282.1 CoA-binding domain protein [Pirellula staleyi DSM 6068]